MTCGAAAAHAGRQHAASPLVTASRRDSSAHALTANSHLHLIAKIFAFDWQYEQAQTSRCADDLYRSDE
jgi:hypothetical protein